MKLHASITAERIADACERHLSTLDNPGFCISCGKDAEGIEPDARGYECECCGALKVYGADELALMTL
jgi:predicted amidophosphoribosyltransferase